MIKSKANRPRPKHIEIDLTGEQGNAHVLLGLANKLAKQLGMSPEEQKWIQMGMKAGDYENLVKVFDEWFGEYVVMYR